MPQSNALWLLGGALPLGVQIVVNLLYTRSWWDLHHSTLGRACSFSRPLKSFDIVRHSVWLSITITGSITQIVKVTVGRPRPGGFTVLGWMTQLYSFQ